MGDNGEVNSALLSRIVADSSDRISWLRARSRGITATDVATLSTPASIQRASPGSRSSANRVTIEAVARHRPGLVLADIQLADGSSGIDAVKEILKDFDVPVIFITAFPERLLTGERPEPTFLITKPFQPETVKAAISQALFFHPSRQREAA